MKTPMNSMPGILRSAVCALSLGLVAAAPFAPSPVQSAQVREAPVPKASLPFVIDLPKGFEVIARPRGPDFQVYDVSLKGREYVGVYTGRAADFPLSKDIPPTRVNRSKNPAVALGRDGQPAEYLWEARASGSQIHIWIDDVTGSKLVLARRIAASIHPQ